MEVARLTPSGALDLGEESMRREIVIEIGCSDRNTEDDEYLPTHSDAFLISFEPLLDK